MQQAYDQPLPLVIAAALLETLPCETAKAAGLMHLVVAALTIVSRCTAQRMGAGMRYTRRHKKYQHF